MSGLRSFLFVPGDSERKLEKSGGVPADAVIIDLEDSVAPTNKAAARELARDFLAAHGGDRRHQLWIRINPLDHPARGGQEWRMPGAAVRLDAASEVLPIDAIGSAVRRKLVKT